MSVERSDLPALVEDWRSLLLPEWRVVLMDEPFPDSDADEYHAISQTRDDYREIVLHFTDDCLARSREAVEVTAVHELLHALTRPGRRLVARLSGHMPYTLIAELRDWQSHEEEQLVDRLSRVLVAIRRGVPAVAQGTFQGPVR